MANPSAPTAPPLVVLSVPAPTHEGPPRQSTAPRFCCLMIIILLVSVISLLLCFVGVSLSESHDPDPYFSVESVSASVEELKWVIGFSVWNPNLMTSIQYYRPIEVSLEDATTKKHIGSSTIPPFKQGRGNISQFDATMNAVNAPWPDHNSTMNSISMVTIKFRTSFDHTGFQLVEGRVYDYMYFACKNVKILFSPNATKGVLYGDTLDCDRAMARGFLRSSS